MADITELGVSQMEGTKWISVPQNKLEYGKENITIYFRNVINLEKISKFTIFITANSKYKLWVNGERVCSGPCKGDKWKHYYDEVDLKDFLKIGENLIAVEVLYISPVFGFKRDKITSMANVTNNFGPMLAIKGDCVDACGRLLASLTTGKESWVFKVDESKKWQNYQGEEYFVAEPFEIACGEKVPFLWNSSVSEGKDWSSVIVAADTDWCGFGVIPILPLAKRPIPMMAEKKGSFFVENITLTQYNGTDLIKIPSNSKISIKLDASQLVTGFLNLYVIGGRNGKIKISYAESYFEISKEGKRRKGNRVESHEEALYGGYDTYYPGGGEALYEPFFFRTFRFVQLDIETKEEAMQIKLPEFIETGYPLEIITKFQSGSAWTTYLWETSIRSLKCCMFDTYVDCPFYELLQYAMDARLEALYTYMLAGDTRLALKAIDDFHSSMTPYGLLQSRAPSESPNIIPVFSLYWIFMLHDYYWQTGDLSPLKRYRPSMDAILDWFERHLGEYGLVENLYYWEFIDWVDEWKYENGILDAVPAAAKAGPCVSTNLIYALALQKTAEVQSACGYSDRAAEYNNRSENILLNVEKHCWSKAKEMYKDGPDFEEYTQHSQALAVLTGLAVGERAKTIMKNCFYNPSVRHCTFAFMYFLFRALEKSELYDMTEELWEYWRCNEALGLTTWPEDFTKQRSDCHGWGSLPIYEFTRCILGVKPDCPGWDRIIIKPICNYIDDASGCVVTKNGIVNLSWKRENGIWSMKGTVPDGIPYRIEFPDGSIREGIGGEEFYFSFDLIEGRKSPTS
jgi:hypothetical protein